MSLEKSQCTCSPCPDHKVCTNLKNDPSTGGSCSPAKSKQKSSGLQAARDHMKESLLRSKEKLGSFRQNCVQHKNQPGSGSCFGSKLAGLKVKAGKESRNKSKDGAQRPSILKHRKSKDEPTKTHKHITVAEPSRSSKQKKSRQTSEGFTYHPPHSQQSVESSGLKQLHSGGDASKDVEKKSEKDEKKQAKKEKKDMEKMEQDRKLEEKQQREQIEKERKQQEKIAKEDVKRQQEKSKRDSSSLEGSKAKSSEGQSGKFHVLFPKFVGQIRTKLKRKKSQDDETQTDTKSSHKSVQAGALKQIDSGGDQSVKNQLSEDRAKKKKKNKQELEREQVEKEKMEQERKAAEEQAENERKEQEKKAEEEQRHRPRKTQKIRSSLLEICRYKMAPPKSECNCKSCTQPSCPSKNPQQGENGLFACCGGLFAPQSEGGKKAIDSPKSKKPPPSAKQQSASPQQQKAIGGRSEQKAIGGKPEQKAISDKPEQKAIGGKPEQKAISGRPPMKAIEASKPDQESNTVSVRDDSNISEAPSKKEINKKEIVPLKEDDEL